MSVRYLIWAAEVPASGGKHHSPLPPSPLPPRPRRYSWFGTHWLDASSTCPLAFAAAAFSSATCAIALAASSNALEVNPSLPFGLEPGDMLNLRLMPDMFDSNVLAAFFSLAVFPPCIRLRAFRQCLWFARLLYEDFRRAIFRVNANVSSARSFTISGMISWSSSASTAISFKVSTIESQRVPLDEPLLSLRSESLT